MNSEQIHEKKRPVGSERPFPWRCRRCGENLVFLTKIPYEAEVRHDGHIHALMIPELELPVCRACGDKVFTEQVDAQVTIALRTHLRANRTCEQARFESASKGERS